MRARLRRIVEQYMPALTQEIERLTYLRRAPHLIIRNGDPVLPDRFQDFATIPGMLPLDQCIRLYFLAYGSAAMGGDVIEIGSWQGRSTCFLAQACRDSSAGVVHAIDHFRGNPGKEHLYATGAADLSDLESNCRANIERVGMSDYVRLHVADASTIAERIRQAAPRVRLLFIDGEHTAEAVRRDIDLYAPLLDTGGLIVFDDYAPKFAAYAAAIQDAMRTGAFDNPVVYERTLVTRKL